MILLLLIARIIIYLSNSIVLSSLLFLQKSNFINLFLILFNNRLYSYFCKTQILSKYITSLEKSISINLFIHLYNFNSNTQPNTNFYRI